MFDLSKNKNKAPKTNESTLTLNVYMDFVLRLPRTFFGHDSIWVIMDRLTKPTHFVAIKSTYPLDRLA